VTLPRDYFEALYTDDDDPWGFRTRWYEERKRGLTMAALLEPRYRTAFEPGCSIGVLTADLADRCDRLLAMDISERAIERAAARRLPGVELRRGSVPGDWPAGTFDLVVLSEIGYYLDGDDCERLAGRALSCAGEVVVVHWRHPVADYPLPGDRVHEIFARRASAAGLRRVVGHVERDLRLESWSRDPRSVAARSGLVR
jgi:hypothetical protein